MATIDVRPATMADAAEMAPDMRAADIAEVRAAGGHTPIESLEQSIKLSAWAWTVRINGKILVIWGVAAAGRGVLAWALTSDLVNKYKKIFWRLSRAGVKLLRRHYQVSFNLIDIRHRSSIEWARRLGFSVGQPVTFGFERRKFVKITLIGDSHV